MKKFPLIINEIKKLDKLPKVYFKITQYEIDHDYSTSDDNINRFIIRIAEYILNEIDYESEISKMMTELLNESISNQIKKEIDNEYNS